MAARPPLVLHSLPRVRRDLAFVQDSFADSGGARDAAMGWRGEGMIALSAEAVDSHAGESLPPWRRRTSFRVVLQPTGEKSPRTAEIDRAFREIAETVRAETGMEPDGGPDEAAFWKAWNAEHGGRWRRSRDRVWRSVRVRRETGFRPEYMVEGRWVDRKPELSLCEWRGMHGAFFAQRRKTETEGEGEWRR